MSAADALGEFLPPIALRLIGDASSLKQALGEGQQAVEQFSKTSQSQLDLTIKKFSTFGLAVGGVMTGAGFAMVQFGKASEDARLVLEQSLTNAGYSYDTYASKIDAVIFKMERYGYSNATAMTALDRLVNATKDPQTAITDLGIAADIAANRHWDLVTSATQLARALSGSPLIFRQFGINVSDMGKAAKAAAKDQTDAAKAHDRYTAAVKRYNDEMDVWRSKARHSEAEYLALKNAALQVAQAQAEYKQKQDAANASAAQAASSQQRIQEAVAQTAKKVSGDAAAVSNTFAGTIDGWKEIVAGFFSNIANSAGPAITSVGAVLTVTSGLVDSIQGGTVWIQNYRAKTLAAAAAADELAAAQGLEATTAQDAAAKEELVAAAQNQVAATAVGATGKVTAFLGKAGLIAAVAYAAGDAISHMWNTADTSVNSNTKDMQGLLTQIGQTGGGIDKLGYQIHGLGTMTYGFNDALTTVGDNHWWDQLDQGVTHLINGAFGTSLDDNLSRAQQSIQGIDQALAQMVSSGHISDAEAAVGQLTAWFVNQGGAVDGVISQLGAYQAALASTLSSASYLQQAYGPGSAVWNEQIPNGASQGLSRGPVAPKIPTLRFPTFHMPKLPNFNPAAEAAAAARAATAKHDAHAAAAAAAAAAKHAAEQRAAAAKAAIKAVTDGLQQTVNKAESALTQLTQAAANMAKNVADSIRRYASVTESIPSAYAMVGQNIAATMKQRAQDIKQFYENIAKLKAQGLNSTSLQDIINAGVAGGGQIASTLAGDTADIASINASQAQINQYSQATGDVSAQMQYGQQIAVAQQQLTTATQSLDVWKAHVAQVEAADAMKLAAQRAAQAAYAAVEARKAAVHNAHHAEKMSVATKHLGVATKHAADAVTRHAEKMSVARTYLSVAQQHLALARAEAARREPSVQITVQGSVVAERDLAALVRRYSNQGFSRNGRSGLLM